MKYIASFSGGKDSTASIILAHENKEPLELILFSEVMFDTNISGELPEHIDFIKNKAFPLFESWGYETKIVKAKETYLDRFFRFPSRGKRKDMGVRSGFPMALKCDINKSLKIKPIKDFHKSQTGEITVYMGIAIDEPRRIERIAKTSNQASLLQKYRYTEKMAFDLCKKYDLLSPIYDFANRGGCWFCPNARDRELKHLRTHHRELWDRLLALENEPDLICKQWNSLTQTFLHDKEELFQLEDAQISFLDV